MGVILMGLVLFCIAFKHAAPLCLLTEYTMFVEKKECAYCLAVNTTICSGYCTTRDPNLKEGRPKFLFSHNQNACIYHEYIHKTITIPGCPMHVDALYTYPVAISCKCGKCNTNYSDCIQDMIKTNYCTKPKKSHYISFSNYIQ
ncbi:thyrotropin subunit beta [Spea bombifrons]|uniref:thyrotropin subunit beta n=1 Tax=Spea bombifrons TaxID=233779 RepID=UPI00234BB74F|nr:thyrotropin subunit beta [Spea bombifrons]